MTITLRRPAGDDALAPPDAQVLAEAAAVVGAGDLMIAWTSARVVLSMTVDAPSETDALSGGWAVARALEGAPGTSVEAEPVPAS